jgi:hypothetical protein
MTMRIARMTRVATLLAVALLLLGSLLTVNARHSADTGKTVDLKPTPEARAPEPGDRLVVVSHAGSTTHIRLLEQGRSGSAQRRPLGFLSPDGATLYTVQETPKKTTVRAYDMESGRELRKTTLNGQYFVPYEVTSPLQLGISGDGRRMLLRRAATESELRAWEASGKPRTEFAVLDTDFSRPAVLFDLAGEFWFDALSRDGKWLYLIEIQDEYPVSYSPERAPNYQVRAYDVDNKRLMPDPIVDKRELDEQMSGYRGTAILSADGNWLYSLYTRPDDAPFIHALNLTDRTALCIDLPFPASKNYEADMLWSMALSRDGRMLYAINGMTGQVAQIDVSNGYTVKQSVTLALPKASADAGPLRNLLARIGRWLAPVAQAKTLRIAGAVLSPDGKTLFATGRTGLLVVDTGKLRLRDRYLPDLELNSLALGAGAKGLYTVAGTLPDPGRLLIVDPQSGALLREITGAGAPRAVLRVGRP